jgi:uncharacterized protein YcbX
MSQTVGRIAALRRYPVKGLSPEALEAIDVLPGQPIAGDRSFAIENGPSGFDPAAPAFIPKQRFLCLMKNARLAGLSTAYDLASSSEDGRAATVAWFTAFMDGELNGPLTVLPAPGGHTFSDTAKGVLSLINHASVRAVGEMVKAAVDPLRFRGNLEIEGFDAWEELDWAGRELVSGEVRMTVVKRTVRCAATNVNPATAERDLKIPATLMKGLGHADCGVYVEVTAPGRLEVGAPIALAATA